MELPPRDHRITLADAAAQTRRHREANVAPVTAHAFHADQVRALLAQPGCAALRIYHGRDAAGGPTLVLVGVDASGSDLTAGSVLEVGYPCPPFCAAGSPLAG
jgi:hypothetical protein